MFDKPEIANSKMKSMSCYCVVQDRNAYLRGPIHSLLAKIRLPGNLSLLALSRPHSTRGSFRRADTMQHCSANKQPVDDFCSSFTVRLEFFTRQHGMHAFDLEANAPMHYEERRCETSRKLVQLHRPQLAIIEIGKGISRVTLWSGLSLELSCVSFLRSLLVACCFSSGFNQLCCRFAMASGESSGEPLAAYPEKAFHVRTLVHFKSLHEATSI